MQALEKGDLILAEKLMQNYIGSVQATLELHPAGGDPLAELRHALNRLSGSFSAPVTWVDTKTAQDLHASFRKNIFKTSQSLAKNLDDNSTYPGALL